MSVSDEILTAIIYSDHVDVQVLTQHMKKKPYRICAKVWEILAYEDDLKKVLLDCAY